jgi:hypothetical protein
MNADEMSKTPTTKPAVRIVRSAPEFFINFRGAYSGKEKLRKQKKQSWRKMDYALRICNLRSNRRGKPFKSVE